MLLFQKGEWDKFINETLNHSIWKYKIPEVCMMVDDIHISHIDFAEVFRCADSREHQRKVQYTSEIRRMEQRFQRSEFLGKRIFRIDGRQK